jgi:hypothetical protein
MMRVLLEPHSRRSSCRCRWCGRGGHRREVCTGPAEDVDASTRGYAGVQTQELDISARAVLHMILECNGFADQEMRMGALRGHRQRLPVAEARISLSQGHRLPSSTDELTTVSEAPTQRCIRMGREPERCIQPYRRYRCPSIRTIDSRAAPEIACATSHLARPR